jgi:hypothetical protein
MNMKVQPTSLIANMASSNPADASRCQQNRFENRGKSTGFNSSRNLKIRFSSLGWKSKLTQKLKELIWTFSKRMMVGLPIPTSSAE